jgi:hypothetical protein
MHINDKKIGGSIFTKNLILLGKLPFRFTEWQFFGRKLENEVLAKPI